MTLTFLWQFACVFPGRLLCHPLPLSTLTTRRSRTLRTGACTGLRDTSTQRERLILYLTTCTIVSTITLWVNRCREAPCATPSESTVHRCWFQKIFWVSAIHDGRLITFLLFWELHTCSVVHITLKINVCSWSLCFKLRYCIDTNRQFEIDIFIMFLYIAIFIRETRTYRITIIASRKIMQYGVNFLLTTLV